MIILKSDSVNVPRAFFQRYLHTLVQRPHAQHHNLFSILAAIEWVKETDPDSQPVFSRSTIFPHNLSHVVRREWR